MSNQKSIGGYLLAILLFPGVVGAGEWFTDEAAAAGLDFVYFNGMSGEYYIVENLGGGAALFDYDNDGDLDLYLVQGRMLGREKSLTDAVFPPRSDEVLRDRLFRNDLAVGRDGIRRLQFTDVTEQSGIRAEGYGMGVTAGDMDNDGWVDLYVTTFGGNQLWRNRGDGTFEDATGRAGVGESGPSVAAAFVDFDRDGRLDLYVGNYVQFSVDKNRTCYAPTSARDYCTPEVYQPKPDRLFRNRGNGTFTDVSRASGIIMEGNNTLGVVAADFNGDGWVDIYVASDGLNNQLWVNQRDGTFVDDALMAGVAVNMEGAAEASMGVDAADFDGDGDEDLFMTHFLGETNTIYVNNGDGWFDDRTTATGLAAPSKAFTSFGTAWFDYDNDGWLDLLVANGGVNVIPVLARGGDPYPLHQPNQLFRNRGEGNFQDVTGSAGKVFTLSEVSRGAAFGDLDNDGDTDVVVANNSGPVRLLINHVGERKHWLGLRLLDRSGHVANGARVAVSRPGGVTLWRRARRDGSYASANDSRVLVGLGDKVEIDKVEVYWTDGRVEVWSGIGADRYHTLRQGEGKGIK
ncbi:MAG: CRTAC1 family protein [Gammaproteobacteria bacterium]|nr:CRTAC1 family protein [Gammaproteobacteria bacterium]